MAGLSTSGLSFSGLATGIDTSSIITGLTKINQARIDSLNAQKTTITTEQTTIATLQADLYDLQTKSTALARSAGSAFDARTATSSDATALTAAAGTAAIPGNYTVTVNSLAQAAQSASAGFSDPNAAIQQGTLSIQVGTGTVTTVTIDSRNNTLQGLANAINAAGGDTRASIINDGTASPYRLLLTSSKTGAANAITVTNNLTQGTGAAINPTAQTIQAASDASVTLGTGTGALTVTSSSNTINNLIPGVSLNLITANSTKPLTLSVATDTTGITKAVQDFVDAYNTARDFITQQSSFDPTSGQAGVLLGNGTTQQLGNDLANALTASIPGLNPNANRLSAVGLAFTSTGDLSFNSSALTNALSTGQYSTDDLKKLFSLSGASDNPGVGFVLGGDKTHPSGPASPYQVNVTAPATRAVVLASGPPAPSIIISPPNVSLQVRVNGLLASGISLDPGTYTPDALVAALQQKINSAPDLQGNFVTVGLDPSGKISIASQLYGSSSNVAVTGGSAAGQLGFTGSESAVGTDVAGNFVVGGKTETATGAGQVLTGSAGNANTDGLEVRSTLSAPGTANLTVGQGLASRLNAVINEYVDPNHGRLTTFNNSLTQQTTDINNTITQQNSVLQAKTTELQQEFANMETAVNTLKGLQTQLAQFAGQAPASSAGPASTL
jgi:flagellar hook-associated protein 2